MNTFVEMAGYTWETGEQIVDVQVTLGSAEKSSSCKVTLADPMHIIASALINHSLKGGGIVALPDTNKAPAVTLPKTGTDNGKAGDGTLSTGVGYDPKVLAFLDTVVKREISQPLTRQGYYSKNGTGFFTDADIASGGGFPASAGTSQNVGRYQVNRGDWSDAVKAGAIRAAFDPASQDALAVYKLKYVNRGWKQLQAGDIRAALRQAANEWVSIPGGAQYQPQNPPASIAEYLTYYQQRLAFHSGNKIDTSTTAAKQVSPQKAVVPAPPAVTSTPLPVIKGSLIRVNIGSFDFSFYHQGTEMSENGQTILTGQGIRWVMSRRVRSGTHKNITLKQLATKVAKDHKVSLDYQATIDPTYSHIDQSGISDYALLMREVEESGLMISEEKSQIVIKERKQLGESKMTLSRGVNLISYKIADKALTGNEEAISVDLPQTNKSTIDPISGKQVSTKIDKDRVAVTSGTITGKVKPKTGGTIKGDKSVSENSKARTKRIGGLPSIFVIPLTAASLVLVPLCTVSTAFLTPVLNRVWVVKTVTHNVGNNTTTLGVVSPVEVVDSNPSPVIPPQVKGVPSTKVDAGRGWVYPVSGTVTSLWSPSRRNPVTGIVRPHRGVDIGAPSGSPIYAADAGIVVRNYFNNGGGGNVLTLLHDNGYTTQYLHMRVPGFPAVGTRVTRGQPIGEVGNTGIGTGAHLHFEIYRVNSAIRENPAAIYSKLGTLGNSCVALKPCD